MTHVSRGTVSVFMLIYGILAAIGNIGGGKMTDRLGVDNASLIIVVGIAATILGIYLFDQSEIGMGVLVASLGLLSYAAVPALQARLLGLAEVYTPQAHGVAAGLNIAGLNSGIALGSLLGGVTIRFIGVSHTGLSFAVIGGVAVIILLAQVICSRSSACGAAGSVDFH